MKIKFITDNYLPAGVWHLEETPQQIYG